MSTPGVPLQSRLYSIDALRVALTVLVIAHHVGQAYGPTGGEWPVMEPARAVLLGPFFTVNRSFFMSLFFMISGYLAAGSYERNGLRAFVRGRLLRLGVPTLAFGLALIPLRLFVFGQRVEHWTQWFDAAHLWYLEHVLLFSLVYALWRSLRPAAKPGLRESKTPGTAKVLGLAFAIAVASGLVRTASPIDRWFNLLGFFRVAFADVPRDLAFFVVGLMAWPRDWWRRFPTRAGLGWLAVGLACAAWWYAYDLFLGRWLRLEGTALDVMYLLWEGLFCCAMCIGLPVLFRQVFRAQGPLGRFLSENQYSAYFWHPLMIVPLQMAALSIALAPLAKFALVTGVGVPIVFLWSYLARRLRFVRSVL